MNQNDDYDTLRFIGKKFFVSGIRNIVAIRTSGTFTCSLRVFDVLQYVPYRAIENLADPFQSGKANRFGSAVLEYRNVCWSKPHG